MNERTRSRARARRIIAVLVCLIVAELAVLVFLVVRYAGGRQEAAGQQPAQEQTATAIPSPTAGPAVELAQTEDMGQAYVDKLVFLGDSTTYGLGFYDVVPFTQVWTPASGTMALANWAIETIDYHPPEAPDAPEDLSITDCAARRRPEVLVITLGVNGVAFLDETSFKQYYTDLVNALLAASPDTHIICQSMYPVIDSKTPDGIDNARVNTANGWIRDVAAATGTRYLNSHDLLTDSTGGLDPAYNNGDDMGIHLNPDGFSVVLQNLRTHAYQ